MKKLTHAAVASALTLTCTLLGATTAQAAETETPNGQLVQAQQDEADTTVTTSLEDTVDDVVRRALEVTPGGHATSDHSAYWPELGMTLTSAAVGAAARAVGSCGTGSVCAYSGSSLSGSKLSWSSCGSHPTSALASVRSIANGRASGTLQARNGSTVRASAAAGTQKNVSGTVTNIYC
jgi:hypothetical protein